MPVEVPEKIKGLMIRLLKEKNKDSINKELECVYTTDISKTQFIKAVQYFKSVYATSRKKNYSIEEQSEVLDIITPSYRVTIQSRPTIQNYCRTNMISENDIKEVVVKNKVDGFLPIYIPSTNFKLQLKSETKLNERSEVVGSLMEMPKMFRYKKRISIVDNGLRYDMTIVKSSVSNTHLNFLESKTISAPEKYEFEIEVLSRTSAEDLLKAIIEAQIVLSDVNHFVDKDNIVSTYLKLINAKENVKPHYVYQNPRKYLVGPKPVSLELKNIVQPPIPGIHNILAAEYTVTEKTDGERHVLYITGSGQTYLINNRFDIIPLNVVVQSHKNSLIDGEWVADQKLYALFDAYYIDGQDIRNLPLVGHKSRMKKLKEFHSKHKDNFDTQGVSLYLKEFLQPTNDRTIFEAAFDILARRDLPYKCDGLIFTPSQYPVGGSHPEDVPNSFGTWNSVLKWKDAKDNTIDFLVKYSRDEQGKPHIVLKDGAKWFMCKLYVGYQPAQWEPIKAVDFLNGVKPQEKYIARQFLPPDYVGDDISQLMLQNGEYNGVSVDDSIMECFFDTDKKEWKILRIREDKTDLLRRNGLNDTANDWGTALNIWRGIQNPVTRSMITGSTTVIGNMIPDENVYYQRNTTRDKFTSRPMMEFHNECIKNMSLIAREKGSCDRLLDLACGKGGDLNKWINADIKEVVGFDNIADNIENPIDGVYARINNMHRPGRVVNNDAPVMAGKTYVFLPMDCSKKLHPENTLKDDDKIIAEALWNIKGSKNDDFTNGIRGMMTKPFDVVSCQFAIHYFFQNLTTLKIFLDNVAQNTKPGGKFIGTCLNGARVREALKDKKINESVSGYAVQGKLMWEITKKYTGDGTSVGSAIAIYMESIGRVAQEYLVDLDLLEKMLEERGFKKEFAKSFESVYNELMNKGEKNERYHEYLNAMTPAEKTYSFMNVMFSFIKEPKEPKAVVVVRKKKDLPPPEEKPIPKKKITIKRRLVSDN